MTATMPALTLDDVLDLKYLGKWAWSPTDATLAWLWDAGGVTDLWLGDPMTGVCRQLTSAKDGVADFAWRPGGTELALSLDGDLFLATPRLPADRSELRLIVSRQDKHGQLAWSPDGSTLAYGCGGAAWLFDLAAGAHRELKLPGRLTAGWQTSAPLGWSRDGAYLTYGFVSESGLPAVGVVAADGRPVWRSTSAATVGGQVWLDGRTLLLRESTDLGCTMAIYLVDVAVAEAAPQLIYHTTGDGKGTILAGPVRPSPDGSRILMLLEDDGWAHYYLYDRPTGALRQVTHGSCEDFGHAGDEPVWSPDGKQVIYASNRAGASWRHLWALDAATGESRQLTFGETTDVQPRLTADGSQLAFVRCDVYRHMDIWTAPLADPQAARQLSFAMPSGWVPANQVKAEEVSYAGALDWPIQAQLYRPHGWRADDGRQYPALVWVHGGPVRQMRPTWHPMHSYALFHAYHQYLLQQGYVVLVINFRGGIGYGRDFRHGLYHKMGVDDVADVVQAGRYLKSLPYVDSERVAVWGLSYGGYMTLHCLTQYPEEFAMGVNLAGIWDIGQWTKWVEKRHGRGGGLFKSFLGGEPEQAPALYAQGSPCTFKAGLRRPLINLHGTDDANVDFAQLDRIVADCVAMGSDYEAYYYPKEVHTFRWRRTWADAFPKIERELAKRLRP